MSRVQSADDQSQGVAEKSKDIEREEIMNTYVKSIRKELKTCLRDQDMIKEKDYYIELIKKAVDAIDELDNCCLGEYSRGRADGMESMAEILTGGE